MEDTPARVKLNNSPWESLDHIADVIERLQAGKLVYERNPDIQELVIDVNVAGGEIKLLTAYGKEIVPEDFIEKE